MPTKYPLAIWLAVLAFALVATPPLAAAQIQSPSPTQSLIPSRYALQAGESFVIHVAAVEDGTDRAKDGSSTARKSVTIRYDVVVDVDRVRADGSHDLRCKLRNYMQFDSEGNPMKSDSIELFRIVAFEVAQASCTLAPNGVLRPIGATDTRSAIAELLLEPVTFLFPVLPDSPLAHDEAWTAPAATFVLPESPFQRHKPLPPDIEEFRASLADKERLVVSRLRESAAPAELSGGDFSVGDLAAYRNRFEGSTRFVSTDVSRPLDATVTRTVAAASGVGDRRSECTRVTQWTLTLEPAVPVKPSDQVQADQDAATPIADRPLAAKVVHFGDEPRQSFHPALKVGDTRSYEVTLVQSPARDPDADSEPASSVRVSFDAVVKSITAETAELELRVLDVSIAPPDKEVSISVARDHAKLKGLVGKQIPWRVAFYESDLSGLSSKDAGPLVFLARAAPALPADHLGAGAKWRFAAPPKLAAKLTGEDAFHDVCTLTALTQQGAVITTSSGTDLTENREADPVRLVSTELSTGTITPGEIIFEEWEYTLTVDVEMTVNQSKTPKRRRSSVNVILKRLQSAAKP